MNNCGWAEAARRASFHSTRKWPGIILDSFQWHCALEQIKLNTFYVGVHFRSSAWFHSSLYRSLCWSKLRIIQNANAWSPPLYDVMLSLRGAVGESENCQFSLSNECKPWLMYSLYERRRFFFSQLFSDWTAFRGWEFQETLRQRLDLGLYKWQMHTVPL